MELINRQDVIDIIMGDGLYCDTYADKVYSAERIKNIPTVEPKKGKWSIEDCHAATYKYCCSECKAHHRARYDYCPTCGARMEESDG